VFLWGLLDAANAQENVVAPRKKVYTTASGEWIFSGAKINNNGREDNGVLRFSPVFNLQNQLHIDPSRFLGFFVGTSIRNVGFIYNVPHAQQPTKKKFRTYNLGIPVGFKIGRVDRFYLFGGYEIEFPINYKEKTFVNERKVDKFNVWFSNRVPAVQHSLFAGIQLPKGTSIKFKYYLTEFFNRDYTDVDDMGISFKPFENVQVNVFYVSLNYNMPHRKPGKKKEKTKIKETHEVRYSSLLEWFLPFCRSSIHRASYLLTY